MEAQAVVPVSQQLPPLSGAGEEVRPDIPPWPVEVAGDHELRHWIPQELDGGEVVVRKQDVEGREPEAGSTVVSPAKDDVEGLGLGQERGPT